MSESVIKDNKEILESIERVPFAKPENNEEDIHKKGSTFEDYSKVWKVGEKAVVTITEDAGVLFALSELGNGTENYSIEIMPCVLDKELLKYDYSSTIKCEKITETYENCNSYDGGEGYLELITKIPEAGKTGETAKGSWDVINQNDYLLWEKYY